MTGAWGRRLAMLLTAGIALLLALLAAAPLLLDRDALARQIEAEISAAIGLPVQVDAVTELRLLPTPRAVLGQLRVLPPAADAGGGDTGPPALASIGALRLELAAPALLLGRVEPTLLHATGLDLHWRPATAVPPPRWLAALPMPALGVRGATLTLDYPPGAKRVHRPLFGGAPADNASDTLVAHAGAEQPGPLRIAATLPLAQAQPQLTGTLTLSGEARLAELPAVELAPLRLVGSGLDIGELRNLSLTISADRARRGADGRWSLAGLTLASGALRLGGDAVLYRATDGRLTAEGRVALAPLDLRDWLAGLRAEPLPGQPETLRCVSADTAFLLDADLLTMAPLALRADATRAGAAATVRLGPVPRAAVAARVDRLDLDPYLTPAAPDGAGTTTADPCVELSASAPTAPAAPAPADDTTELRLELTADRLRVGGLSYGGLRVVAGQRGPVTDADIDAADFYGGPLSAHVEQVLQAGAPPRQLLRADVRDADLGALLTDLQGGSPQVTGRAGLMADLAATGADAAALRRDLSGTVRVDLRDARLAALDEAAAKFGPLLSVVGLPVTPDTLALSRLQVGAQARGGLFDIVDVDGRARLFRLSGAGTLDAGTETLDLDLAATLVQPPDGPDLKRLAGIRVPIRVTGSIAAPKVDAELRPAVAEAARRHLNGDGNLFQQLEDATGVQGLEQGLRGLFGF